MSGRAAHRTTRPASSATFVPNSSVWGAIRSVLAIADEEAEDDPSDRPPGTVFGSVIMKNRKIITSGEVTMTRQKSKPHTGANAQLAVMQWPDAASTPEPTASVTQNDAASGEQLQAPRDQQAADDDHGVGREHPDVERRPPEVERLDARAAEDDERDDQADVRRVEDVRAAVLDHVLGQQRQAGDDGEDVPGVRCPVLVRWRADDAQDQGDAAAGEHRAGRPDERPLLPERERDLEHRAGQDRGQDLRHADPEASPTWPRTWIVMITAATCSRGSRMLGRTSG